MALSSLLSAISRPGAKVLAPLLLVLLAACGPAATPEPTSGLATTPASTSGVATTPAPLSSDARLFFQARRGESYDIYSANVDGSDVQQVTDDPGSEIEPDLAPDRTRLVYAAGPADDNALQLYIYDLRTRQATPLLSSDSGAIDFAPVWSPDGTQIAFQRITPEGDSQIYLVNSDGSNERQLTSGGERHFRPDWMPDGQSLVFVMSGDGESNKIYRIGIDGQSEPELLIDPGQVLGADAPAVSPDGQQIAFSARDNTVRLIYVARIDGSDMRVVVPADNSEGLIYSLMPAWADDQTILFAGSNEVLWGIYRIQDDGSDMSQVIDFGDAAVNSPVVR